MRHSKLVSLFILLFALPVLLSPAPARAALDKKVLNLINKVVFEVVVLKLPEGSTTYDRPLPLDLLPYLERTDKYYSVGTAFAISPTELVSAAHVLSLDQESQFKDYFIRDSEGKVYPIGNIVSYSERRDFVTFSVARPGVCADLKQAAVLYRIGYRKEGSHGQQEMEAALDGFAKRVTILEGERK
jgi:hypothetical protein